LDKIESLKNERTRKHGNLFKNLKEAGKIKFAARETLNYFYNYKEIFRPYIQELSRRFKRQDMPWLGFKEIIGITNGKDVSLSDRDKTDWLLSKKNGWELIKGTPATKIMKIFDNHFSKRNVELIKGFSASPGKKKGIVKVLKTVFSDNVEREIKKVKQGNILIASTTGPEIMVACRKSGAIVTDEGGITSHAAIISRELKIPCIVGTKIATKVLKDGDLVEVDADHGMVKIMKSRT